MLFEQAKHNHGRLGGVNSIAIVLSSILAIAAIWRFGRLLRREQTNSHANFNAHYLYIVFR